MGGLLVIAGLVGLALGGLQVMAGSMSDAPELGDEYARRGCLLTIVGALTLIAGAALMLQG